MCKSRLGSYWLPSLLNVTRVLFFSSRRRHTRYWRDWSSDVCSSDLGQSALKDHGRCWIDLQRSAEYGLAGQLLVLGSRDDRSEERRVGKECRSRWSPYH